MKRFTFWECTNRRGELSAFESGELTPERAERVAAHLSICSRCRRDWETVSGVAALLRAGPPTPGLPPADLWSRIESEILEPIPAPPPSPSWRRPAFALSLSGAALAAIAAVVVPRIVAPPVVSSTPVSAVEAIAPAPTAAPVAVAKADLARADAPPVIYAEPTPEPAPRPVSVRRASAPARIRHSARVDPFEPVPLPSHPRRRAAPRRAAPPPVVAIAQPSDNAPEAPEAVSAPVPGATPEMDAASNNSEARSGETLIPVTKPALARTALRDVRTEAESAERRSEAAMESPLDAVERASRARRLFP